MANEFDIFNVSVKDLDTGERPSTAGSDLYTPKPDQGQDGIYRSLIRTEKETAFMLTPHQQLEKKILSRICFSN